MEMRGDTPGTSREHIAVIVFDLDRTLTESKSPIDTETAQLLCDLLKQTRVAIISGGLFSQIKKQVLEHLDATSEALSHLYILPTSGTSLYTYKDGSWHEEYKEDIEPTERVNIIQKLTQAIADAQITLPEQVYGEQIEDRKSQITFSAFGQEAPAEAKRGWDTDLTKRTKIQTLLAPQLPDYEIQIGGSNSLDITKKGVDKGYGVEKLSEHLHIPISDMFFIGDRLEPGGNDHPVVRTGIRTLDVSGPEEAKQVIRKLLFGEV